MKVVSIEFDSARNSGEDASAESDASVCFGQQARRILRRVQLDPRAQQHARATKPPMTDAIMI